MHAKAGRRPSATSAALLPLAGAPDPARLARRFAERQTASFGADVVDAAALVATELVTNAVLHTPDVVELEIGCRRDGVVLSVTDRSSTPPRPRRHSLHAGTGRGLQLAAGYAQAWGVEPAPEGKRVWVHLTRRSVARCLRALPEGDLSWADL